MWSESKHLRESGQFKDVEPSSVKALFSSSCFKLRADIVGFFFRKLCGVSFSMCFYARTTLSVFFFRKLCGFSFFFDVFLCAFFVHYASFGKIMERSLLFFGATLRVLYLLFILCPRLQHYFFLVFFFLVCL